MKMPRMRLFLCGMCCGLLLFLLLGGIILVREQGFGSRDAGADSVRQGEDFTPEPLLYSDAERVELQRLGVAFLRGFQRDDYQAVTALPRRLQPGAWNRQTFSEFRSGLLRDNELVAWAYQGELKYPPYLLTGVWKLQLRGRSAEGGALEREWLCRISVESVNGQLTLVAVAF